MPTLARSVVLVTWEKNRKAPTKNAVSWRNRVLQLTQHSIAFRALFGLVALAFLANAGLGGYHSGVEWGFWAGPETCSGATAPLATGKSLLDQLKNAPRIIRCDEAPWRFAGLSFAGWNAVVSFVLMLFAGWAASRRA